MAWVALLDCVLHRLCWKHETCFGVLWSILVARCHFRTDKGMKSIMKDRGDNKGNTKAATKFIDSLMSEDDCAQRLPNLTAKGLVSRKCGSVNWLGRSTGAGASLDQCTIDKGQAWHWLRGRGRELKCRLPTVCALQTRWCRAAKVHIKFLAPSLLQQVPPALRHYCCSL